MVTKTPATIRADVESHESSTVGNNDGSSLLYFQRISNVLKDILDRLIELEQRVTDVEPK